MKKQIDRSVNSDLKVFRKEVALKFQLYNSLFTALPFHRVEKTGVLLSIFMIHCEEGYAKNQSPVEIVESFLEQHTELKSDQEMNDIMFRFIQYSERQVVLFDALEDASFSEVYDLTGPGTLKHLQSEVVHHDAQKKLADKMKDFSVRLVLTAHPTQFYPSDVLVIINDLAKAIIDDNTAQVNSYLQQLGKTPFFKSEKPTPYDEAVNQIWFLENVFYHAAGEILSYLADRFPDEVNGSHQLIRLGFWPGGDRDGNPFVRAGTTLRVANTLKNKILQCYHADVRILKRRLTFKGVSQKIVALEKRLQSQLINPDPNQDIKAEEIIRDLVEIKDILQEEHAGLFQEPVENLLRKVELFRLFFASLDIRQDSSMHSKLLDTISSETDILPEKYGSLTDTGKMKVLAEIKRTIDTSFMTDELFLDTMETIQTIQKIQDSNGEAGCHRYIISHTTCALDVMQVYGLFLLAGWSKKKLSIDLVPLFESIHDLNTAADVMRELYQLPAYRDHLSRRENTQTIMLGFSDGTKDGGYLMANWSIYKAKEALSAVSKEFGIQVIFFDGRGGPPARGGGRTHQFYASMGSNIASKEIQLTVQGQTISANFGTIDTARYNMEQLIHAGIWNGLFSTGEATLTSKEDRLLQQMADESLEAYSRLKNMPNFLEYLNFASPLRYYGEANIGSRPSKRKPGKLNLDDLRAVPYVGAWSQLKQNLPGYFGVGTAMERLEEDGKWGDIEKLYERSLFFKSLLDNCEMAMTKCFFPLTAYLSDHPQYGTLWNIIYDEFLRTRKYLLRLSGAEEFMAGRPVNQLSVQMRQRIELPLLTIQQYALNKIRELEETNASPEEKIVYEKLAMRCSFGIINAERNSA